MSDRPPGFVARPNRDGKTFRYYWQPNRTQKAAGYKAELRLPDAPHEAYAACRKRGEEVDAAIAAARRLADRPAEALSLAARASGEVNASPVSTAAPAAAVRRALAGVAGTLAHAIARFKTKKRYLQRADRTREFYDYLFAIIEKWGGHLRMRAIDEETIVTLHEVLTDQRGARVANAVVERLRYLFKVAQRRGELTANPCYSEDLGLHTVTPAGIPWPRDAAPAFVAKADAIGLHSIGTAIFLNEWFGQREGDLLAFPRALYRNGTLYFWQSKTGAVAPLPADVVPKLAERIERELWHQQQRGVVAGPGAKLILREATGQPWDRHAFGYAFQHVRAEVALERPEFELDAIPKRLIPELYKNPERKLSAATPQLIFKDLRHTAILRLHEAGVPFELIRQITGHADPKTVWDHYIMASEAATRTAFSQRLAHEEGKR